ncbi:DNA polymerase IV [hydrothermal vent metagenome]|uniref:DNA-directed DNA polymerase n=1 Tax=hydrothermal vent metagenome TaxID=652676 RepID=A0A3B0SCG5_9ZZZZ
MSRAVWCRDCANQLADTATICQACDSVRLLVHDEVNELSIAHLDCDAFYASIEKRDRPELNAIPLLIGGTGGRSVVATACYLARAYGARSAMPMSRAKKLCPQAVILPPDIAKYAKVGQQIRQLMQQQTPLVEPLSIDEAFMDLSGTQRLHGGPPVQTLIRLQNQIEQEVGIGVSIGLSHNKFLAKTASDLDKPRGFSVIGHAETLDFLAPKPPMFVYGVGPAFGQKLQRDGFLTLGQIRECSEQEMMRRYGDGGARLSRLSKGIDNRPVNPVSIRKSISAETTFARDIFELEALQKILWRMCEKTSALAKKKHMAGFTLSLKLKTSAHQIRTRSITMEQPIQLADTLYRELSYKLQGQTDGTRFRLIGAGLSSLISVETDFIEPVTDLLDHSREKRARAERAMDTARQKFGKDAILKGRGLQD